MRKNFELMVNKYLSEEPSELILYVFGLKLPSLSKKEINYINDKIALDPFSASTAAVIGAFYHMGLEGVKPDMTEAKNAYKKATAHHRDLYTALLHCQTEPPHCMQAIESLEKLNLQAGYPTDLETQMIRDHTLEQILQHIEHRVNEIPICNNDIETITLCNKIMNSDLYVFMNYNQKNRMQSARNAWFEQATAVDPSAVAKKAKFRNLKEEKQSNNEFSRPRKSTHSLFDQSPRVQAHGTEEQTPFKGKIEP